MNSPPTSWPAYYVEVLSLHPMHFHTSSAQSQRSSEMKFIWESMIIFKSHDITTNELQMCSVGADWEATFIRLLLVAIYSCKMIYLILWLCWAAPLFSPVPLCRFSLTVRQTPGLKWHHKDKQFHHKGTFFSRTRLLSPLSLQQKQKNQLILVLCQTKMTH